MIKKRWSIYVPTYNPQTKKVEINVAQAFIRKEVYNSSTEREAMYTQ